MKEFDSDHWDKVFDEKARTIYTPDDPGHDYSHILRVLKTAVALAKEEGADLNIVVPAAYFHDYINPPKKDPRAKQASVLSADAAAEFLLSVDYPKEYIEGIKHAIAAHSFSAGITPETIEAKVLQDADRIDGLGAIGVARWIAVSTRMHTPIYDIDDPWAENREYNGRNFALDHLPEKIFKLAGMMNTKSATKEAKKREQFFYKFVEQIKLEI